MNVSYGEFINYVSRVYWNLPEPIRSDMEVYFCPEECKLHRVEYVGNKVAYDTMAEAQRFDSKSGKGLVMVCYQSNPPHMRSSIEHFRRLLVHESEHCFRTDRKHSEHPESYREDR